MADGTPLSVLCVCTGNICRSPAAERLLASRLGPSIAVASAGTHALVGQPVSAPMDSLLEAAGAESSRFRARRLTEGMVRSAGVVLTMTRAHRRDAVELWPGAVRRTFTLKEFARLLTSIGAEELPAGPSAERLRAAIPLVARHRRQVLDPREDEVVDPYRQSDEVYAAAFTDIERAVGAIVEVISPSGHPAGPLRSA